MRYDNSADQRGDVIVLGGQSCPGQTPRDYIKSW